MATITIAVTQAPAHGTFDPANWTYTAAAGYAGPQDTLDASVNIFQTFSTTTNLAPLTDALGERYEVERTGFKFYGCCRGIHATRDRKGLQNFSAVGVEHHQLLRVAARAEQPVVLNVHGQRRRSSGWSHRPARFDL